MPSPKKKKNQPNMDFLALDLENPPSPSFGLASSQKKKKSYSRKEPQLKPNIYPKKKKKKPQTQQTRCETFDPTIAF